ncbi:hypothetical protein [Flavobacterium sp.]|jgi:hypothetical protein|uniref:hypothetical protein n=1 Tax=Flavobacterium sp. TaxID=239 RepID=UPI0037C1311F
MALAGILKSAVNTGSDSDLSYAFATPTTIISNCPVSSSDSINLRRTTSAYRAQRWEIETNIVPSDNDPGYLVSSVVAGYNKLVYIRMPQVFRGSERKSIPTITLSAASLAGTQIINFSGGTLQKGEFIQFGSNLDSNNRKVYIVTSVTTNSATIEPPLNSTKAIGLEVKYDKKVTLVARFDTSALLGITYTDGVLQDPGSVKFIEALK